MKIRKIKKEEINAAARLIRLNYSRHYEKLAKREIKEMFQDSAIRSNYIVAEEKNKIVGLAGFMQSWMDYHVYHIIWVNVAPEHQRKGIGQALIKKIIKAVRKKDVNLILLTTTVPGFYKRFGFKNLMGFRKNYYLMCLQLQ